MAFSWGYLDVIDDAGNGVVVIWGFAQPFLPGTVARSRAGSPASPGEEPSLCVAVYEDGRPSFYLLERLIAGPEPDPYQPLDLGAVRVEPSDGALTVHLNCPVPGAGNLTGTVRIEGPPSRVAEALQASDHRWAPRMLGPAVADLTQDDWAFRMEGRGYHDGNVSRVGLDRLGIRQWVWGRVPMAHGDWIYYLVDGHDPQERTYITLFVQPDGAVVQREVEVHWGRSRRGAWGLSSPRMFTVDGYQVTIESFVDDGPFYQRGLTTVRSPGGEVYGGVGEYVDVTAMDSGITAPLTKMAVFDPRGGSWFAPLFNGRHRGGLLRLIRYWLGR